MTWTYYGVALSYGPKPGVNRVGKICSHVIPIQGDRPLTNAEAVKRARDRIEGSWDEGQFGPLAEMELTGSAVSVCVSTWG